MTKARKQKKQIDDTTLPPSDSDIEKMADLEVNPADLDVAAVISKAINGKAWQSNKRTLAMLGPFLEADDEKINEMALALVQKSRETSSMTLTDAFLSVFDKAQETGNWHEAMAEIFRSGAARIMVMLSRAHALMGEEPPKGAADE